MRFIDGFTQGEADEIVSQGDVSLHLIWSGQIPEEALGKIFFVVSQPVIHTHIFSGGGFLRRENASDAHRCRDRENNREESAEPAYRPWDKEYGKWVRQRRRKSSLQSTRRERLFLLTAGQSGFFSSKRSSLIRKSIVVFSPFSQKEQNCYQCRQNLRHDDREPDAVQAPEERQDTDGGNLEHQRAQKGDQRGGQAVV